MCKGRGGRTLRNIACVQWTFLKFHYRRGARTQSRPRPRVRSDRVCVCFTCQNRDIDGVLFRQIDPAKCLFVSRRLHYTSYFSSTLHAPSFRWWSYMKLFQPYWQFLQTISIFSGLLWREIVVAARSRHSLFSTHRLVSTLQ